MDDDFLVRQRCPSCGHRDPGHYVGVYGSDLCPDQWHSPIGVAKRAAEGIEYHRMAMSRMATARGWAIRKARDAGMSWADIASELGISRQQAHEIARRADG